MVTGHPHRRSTDRQRLYWIKGWGPALALAFLTGLVVASFAFAKLATDRAIDRSEQAAIEQATAEAKRADAAICRIAGTNRAQSILLLETLRQRVAQAPLDPGETQAEHDETLEVADRLIATARHPFPEPCTRYTPDLP